MKKFLLSLVLCCLWSIQGIRAQDLIEPSQSCRTKEENELIYKNNPNSRKEHSDFDVYSRKFAAQRAKSTTSKTAAVTYTIPVVFHIYGTVQSGKTVTYEKIVNHLKQLNDDFNGLNADYNTVEPFFQARRATLNIQFKLAKIDPNGGCTSGVVFHSAKNGYGNGGGYDEEIAADAWDNTKYMNIYIQNDLYNDGVLNNSGVAWYPNSGMTASNTARVVFNGRYLYDNYSNKEFTATLTHEFGHFLNLIHTFDGGCAGTDQVDDTPIEDGKHSLSCTPGTNCSGDKVNIENYMGYNGSQGCYKMFTQGQVNRMLAALNHPARQSLWQPANLTATGVNAIGNSVTANSANFKEDVLNNGSFTTSSLITLNGTTFVKSSGTLLNGTDFTSTLPAGLTAIITLNSTTEATLTISGMAVNHSSDNNTTGGITLLASAITGGLNGMQCNSLYWNFKFRNPYGIFYNDINDPTASAIADWKYFDIIKGDDTGYGVWQFASNHLKVETYGKRLVANAGTKNITPLGFNTAINASSNFTAPGAYPNQLDLRTPTHTTWDGKTDYIGFEYSIDGEICYGWFKATVAADGSGYSITEYAYNTQPGGTIYTGMTDKIALSISPLTISETLVNDGSVSQVVSFKLTTNNGKFTKNTGLLVLNTDYTISGVPAGLTAKLNLISETEAQMVFTGKATSHAKANKASVMVTFLDPIIVGGASGLSSSSGTVAIKFKDPYTTKYEKNINYTVDAANTWKSFSITADADDAWYGLYIYKGSLKFETYKKSLVCEASTVNITFIDQGQTIDGTSNFVKGGGDSSSLHILRDSNYKSWDGRTGYIGFKFSMDGEPCYGWFKVKVDAKGTSYTLLEYFYNTTPYATITTDPLPVDPLVHLYNKQDVIKEDPLINDGSFSSKIDISLLRNTGTFTKSSGNLVEGTDFTVTGVPAGLTTSIKILSNTTAEVSYVGKATAHEFINGSIATVTFLNPAITGGVAVLDASYFKTQFVFSDFYKIVSVDLATPLTASATKSWTAFSITADADNNAYGVYFTANTLKLETYLKQLVCESGINNISYLGGNTIIDGTNNWDGTKIPTLSSSSYNVWNGKTGYIGFRYTKDGFYHYGYFLATVNADGLSYTITKYAYNTEPLASITTPVQLGSVHMANTPAVITEDKLTNDGTFSTTIAVELTTNGGTFTKSSGNLVEGTDFTVTGLPAGLTAAISLTNNSTAVVSYIGKATAHEVANASTATITFMDAAITGGVAMLENKSFTTDFTFVNVYNVVYVDLPTAVIVSATNPTGSFRITADVDANDTEFNLFFAADGLKFLTNKGLVSETGANTISIIGTSQTIGGTSNWNPSGNAIISNSIYNNWNGKTGFIGFRFTKNGSTYYGYFEAAVSADGQSYAVIRYAYNLAPEVPIMTPSTVDAFTFPTLNTTDFETTVSFTNYPNPFNEVINISSSSFSGKKVEILIYNSLGQNLFNKSYDKDNDTIAIDGSNFGTGFYFLKVIVDSKVQAVKKIMKN